MMNSFFSRITVTINLCNCVWINCWVGPASSRNCLETREWTQEWLVLVSEYELLLAKFSQNNHKSMYITFV